MDPRLRTWLPAAESRLAARRLGVGQHQVVGRRQLVAAGVPRWLIRAEVRVGRWRLLGRQLVVLHTGPLTSAALRWVAVLGTCPRAALDGVTGLQEAGLVGLHDVDIHVIAPRGSEPRAVPGVVVHESRRFREQDVITSGIRRMSPAVAAVHAALWAVSDRQAQLFLLMTVQQRLATPDAISDALSRVRRHKRRRLLLDLVADMGAGVQSLGELDVAHDFRRRGFPEPDRQAVRRRPSGTEYLDVRLSSYSLVFEIDGAGHDAPAQQLADLLRDISIAGDGDTVIRIPLVLYRMAGEQVLDRIEGLLEARGWHRRAA